MIPPIPQPNITAEMIRGNAFSESSHKLRSLQGSQAVVFLCLHVMQYFIIVTLVYNPI